jgi:prolyl-tRNA editing enzyme YbaK/EbsC (Cys-tRNA(Pro) deacylase)
MCTITLLFDRLAELLGRRYTSFIILPHDPVVTSEEAARIRGTPLAGGAKALVCKVDVGLVMFVVPADRKLDGRSVRGQKGWRKL